MERIGSEEAGKALARLVNGSGPTSELSLRRLSDSEDQQLQTLLEQMAERYPHQDLTESSEGYLWDYQQLALRYSLAEVQNALAEWRLTPGANFFPLPNEIAARIEQSRESMGEAQREMRQHQQRAREIAEFWRWAPEWMQMTGNDEAELLRRFPSYKGTKPL